MNTNGKTKETINPDAAEKLFVLDPNPQGKRVVLLLHGLGADSEAWTLQIPALVEAGMRPVAPDLPGFGQSVTSLRRRWTIRGVARRTARLVERLGCGPVDVVGHSLGGTVAQQFALDYPHLTRRLVLANTFARLRPRNAGEWQYLLRRLIVANVRGVDSQAEMVAWRVFPRPEDELLRGLVVEKIRRANPLVYRAAMRELALFDSRRRLSSIRVPTLVITGANDTTVGLDRQAELVKLIPGARQVIIPNANHAVIVDQYEAFNQALIPFLKEGP